MLVIIGWILFAAGATLIIVFGWVGIDTGTPIGSITNIAGLNSGGFLMISGAVFASAGHVKVTLEKSQNFGFNSRNADIPLRKTADSTKEETRATKPFERKFKEDDICAGCGVKLTSYNTSGGGLCTDCAFIEFSQSNP